jgi:hypothetical protein
MSKQALMPLVSDGLRARLLSQQCVGALAPYEAIPSCARLTISNDVFANFLWNSQGLTELVGSRVACKCAVRGLAKEPLVENHEDHCQECGGGMSKRHNTVCSTLAACLRSAGVLVNPTFQKRVGTYSSSFIPDIEVTGLPADGQEAFVEVSITSPFQKERLKAAMVRKLSAATTVERAKTGKYAGFMSKHVGKTLYVAVMETTGAFGKQMSSLLNELDKLVSADGSLRGQLAMQWSWASNTFKRFWRQALSISLWKGAMSMVEGLVSKGGRQGEAVVRCARQPSEWSQSPRINDCRRHRDQAGSPPSSQQQ